MTNVRTRALATLAALSLALAAVDAAPSSAAVKIGLRSSIAVSEHVDGIARPKSLSTERILPQDAMRTPAPDRRGWKDATPMKLVGFTDCKAKTIREWVMIRCEMWPERVDLIAGNPAGVDAWETEGDANTSAEAVVVFPMRRGDRRVFQLSSASRYSSIPEILITELWLPDDPAPSLIVQRI